jgi:hypothetical protein
MMRKRAATMELPIPCPAPEKNADIPPTPPHPTPPSNTHKITLLPAPGRPGHPPVLRGVAEHNVPLVTRSLPRARCSLGRRPGAAGDDGPPGPRGDPDSGAVGAEGAQQGRGGRGRRGGGPRSAQGDGERRGELHLARRRHPSLFVLFLEEGKLGGKIGGCCFSFSFFSTLFIPSSCLCFSSPAPSFVSRSFFFSFSFSFFFPGFSCFFLPIFPSTQITIPPERSTRHIPGPST